MKSGSSFTFDYGHKGASRLDNLHRIFAQAEQSSRRRVRRLHGSHFEFLEKRGIDLANLRESGARKMAASTLAGLLVLTPMSGTSLEASPQGTVGHTAAVASVEDVSAKLAVKLKEVVFAGYENLNAEQEVGVSKAVEEVLNVSARPEAEGRRLNRTFGLIGAEQHLYRFPGDTIRDHAKTGAEMLMYGRSGIAPGLGAYGYFARSRASLTEEDVLREKWYVVAQTFLSPGFKENPMNTVKFFKYRKFLVVNPDTGQAVVGDLADAGPAEYTGKSFGGSPEVMHYLGYGGGSRKGRVVFFFLDDPRNEIPLGPISSRFEGGRP